MADILEALRNEATAAAEAQQKHLWLEPIKAHLRAEYERRQCAQVLEAMKELKKEKGAWLNQVCGLPWLALEDNSATEGAKDLVRKTRTMAAVRDHIDMYISRLASLPQDIENLDPDGERQHKGKYSTLLLTASYMTDMNLISSLRRDIQTLEYHLELVQKRKVTNHSAPPQETVVLQGRPKDPTHARTEFNVFDQGA